MKNSTLCYLERDGKYLMLHRIKKVNDENRDKWIGLGGKVEEGESPHDCIRREVYEEAGITLYSVKYRGLITFVSDEYGTQYMHLFTSSDFSDVPLRECDEGVLEWVDKRLVPTLPLWEGDKIFLSLLDTEERHFSLKLVYRGDELISHFLE